MAVEAITIEAGAEIKAGALRRLVEAIENNNRVNQGSWLEWGDAVQAEEAYVERDEDFLCPVGADVVERAIRSNGATLPQDLNAVHAAVWGGYEVSGGFWGRSE